MSPKCSLQLVSTLLVVVVSVFPARAAEESIDTLLNKLPSPQKMVRPRVQEALQDPATKNPLASRAFAALESGDYRGALNLGRQLVQKAPNSAVLTCFMA